MAVVVPPVPVRIKSPGNSVVDWLMKLTTFSQL